MKPKRKSRAKKGEPTRNVRIYTSSLKIIRPLADKEGKTIPRIIDEKFNPQKYQAR